MLAPARGSLLEERSRRQRPLLHPRVRPPAALCSAFRDLVSVGPEDHSPTIVSDLDVCFAEALAYTASLTSGVYTTFRRHLDPRWIEEALATTGTATVRKRRLPAEQVVWLVIGMALPTAMARPRGQRLPAGEGRDGDGLALAPAVGGLLRPQASLRRDAALRELTGISR